MTTLGNILWHFPFLGFITAAVTFLVGLLLTVTVVAAPIGLGLIELSKLLLWPFGQTMVSKSDLGIHQNPLWQAYSTIIMVLYVVFVGVWLAIATIIQAVCTALTIVGIPVALVVAKSVGTYFNPVNKKCVPMAVRDEIQRRKAQDFLRGNRG